MSGRRMIAAFLLLEALLLGAVWLGYYFGIEDAKREQPARITICPCAATAERLDAMVREMMSQPR